MISVPTARHWSRDAVIEAGRRTPLLILDLHDVCFCDAAGMHMLVAVHDALIASRGHLSLRPVSRSVERVLTLCGAEDLLLGSDIDASPAPPSTLASPPSLVITNRDHGRVIEVLVQGELRTATSSTSSDGSCTSSRCASPVSCGSSWRRVRI